MDCIGQTDARVRSGGAGDVVRIGKPSRRGNRVCLADPAVQPVINTRAGS